MLSFVSTRVYRVSFKEETKRRIYKDVSDLKMFSFYMLSSKLILSNVRFDFRLERLLF